jgi:hypothetical protein
VGGVRGRGGRSEREGRWGRWGGGRAAAYTGQQLIALHFISQIIRDDYCLPISSDGQSYSYKVTPLRN